LGDLIASLAYEILNVSLRIVKNPSFLVKWNNVLGYKLVFVIF
jgi:hypothetical protein